MNNVMNKYYNIAGIGIKVSIDSQYLAKEDGILEDYLSEDDALDETVVVEVVDKLSEPYGELIYSEPSLVAYAENEHVLRYDGFVERGWEEAYMRLHSTGDKKEVQLKREAIPNKLQSKLLTRSLELEHLLVKNKGIILHAAYIEYQGKAILFTAPSGTGKSTQSDLWVKFYDAELINGDRAAIRLHEDGVYAWGIPLSGMSSVHKNVKLPLAAIVYLGQAPGNRIQKLSGVKAFRKFWEGCSINVWYHEDIQYGSQVAAEIISKIPVFSLECVPDRSAADLLYHELERLDIL